MEIRIPLDWPNLGPLEKEYVLRAIDTGYVSTAGPFVNKFEQSFVSYLGCKYAIAVANGTSGLHLALRILGIGPGDEVIVPALTFIATVNPIIYVGATPVVVDVSPSTWTIDPKEVEAAITPKTKAIIPVHVYGNPCDMRSINLIAARYHIYVIEDATEALGSLYEGKYAGTLGDVGVFSFNGNKVITTGGGGMIITNKIELADKAKLLVNQGRADTIREYEHAEIGYNYRLTNLQASLGLAQLERLGDFLLAKRDIVRIYKTQLGGQPGLRWQEETVNAQSNWWLASILVDREQFGEDRDSIMGRLASRGIQTRLLFKPIPEQPCYRDFKLGHCNVANYLYSAGFNLPSATFLMKQQIDEVCTAIMER